MASACIFKQGFRRPISPCSFRPPVWNRVNKVSTNAWLISSTFDTYKNLSLLEMLNKKLNKLSLLSETKGCGGEENGAATAGSQPPEATQAPPTSGPPGATATTQAPSSQPTSAAATS